MNSTITKKQRGGANLMFYCPREDCPCGPKTMTSGGCKTSFSSSIIEGVLSCPSCSTHLIQCENCYALTDCEPVQLTFSLLSLPAFHDPGKTSTTSESSGSSTTTITTASQPKEAHWEVITCKRCGFLNLLGELRDTLLPSASPIRPMPEPVIKAIDYVVRSGTRHQPQTTTTLEPSNKKQNMGSQVKETEEKKPDEDVAEVMRKWSGHGGANNSFSDCHLRMLKALYGLQNSPDALLKKAGEFLEIKSSLFRLRKELSGITDACSILDLAPPTSITAVSDIFQGRRELAQEALIAGTEQFHELLGLINNELRTVYGSFALSIGLHSSLGFQSDSSSSGSSTISSGEQSMTAAAGGGEWLSCAFMAVPCNGKSTLQEEQEDVMACLKSKATLLRLLYRTVSSTVL